MPTIVAMVIEIGFALWSSVLQVVSWLVIRVSVLVSSVLGPVLLLDLFEFAEDCPVEGPSSSVPVGEVHSETHVALGMSFSARF